jgi:hypothetical protein
VLQRASIKLDVSLYILQQFFSSSSSAIFKIFTLHVN